MFIDDVPHIADLLARYYKSPEVMIGYAWDFGIDMWSAACSLFELFTGSPLFTGNTDNQMLKQIFELRGCYNQKVLKRAIFIQDHFDLQANLFMSMEIDNITRQPVIRDIPIGSFKGRELDEKLNISKTETRKDLLLFKDLLDKCLLIDPERRITPEDALRHAFFKKSASKT